MINSIDFEKTLFSKKENRKEMLYLVDELIGFNRHQRMAEDAVAAVLQEAVQTSYQTYDFLSLKTRSSQNLSYLMS